MVKAVEEAWSGKQRRSGRLAAKRAQCTPSVVNDADDVLERWDGDQADGGRSRHGIRRACSSDGSQGNAYTARISAADGGPRAAACEGEQAAAPKGDCAATTAGDGDSAPPMKAQRRTRAPAGKARSTRAQPQEDMRAMEREAAASGYATVAGVDEAGRGPWAGPVVAAACILPLDLEFPGLNDSKALSEAAREALYAQLTAHARVTWAIAIQGHEEVDQLNILGATLRAMVQAAAALGTADTRIPVQAESADVLCNGTPPCLGVLTGGLLGVQPTMILVDGNRLPPGGFEGGVPARSVVKGDARVACIAAASILAKVTRDRQMKQYGLLYPGYGFEQHKGYGVPAHAEALRRLGPCPIHRRSFEPIKSMVGWSRPPALQPAKARLPLQPKPAQLVEEQQLAEGRATARRRRAGH